MIDAEQKAEQPQDGSLSQRRGRRWPIAIDLFSLLHAAVASIPVAAAFGIAGWFGNNSKLDLWTCLAIAGAGALTASCLAALVRWRFWSRPSQSLLETMDQARRSEIPIEDLSKVRGNLAPLADAIQEMLELEKLLKASLLEMEQEMRGRIATRTDALERKIGSLQHQAMRDALTGLHNRRSLEKELPRFVTEHLENARNACLLMIDVDHFKALNDTLGHAAGDNLLREIGQIIRSTIREHDLAVRCGGDEFVILLSEASLDTGQGVSRRLESLVAVLAQPLHLPAPPRLSVGVCALSEMAAPSPEAWLEIADKRLYALKASRSSHRKPIQPQSLKKSA